MQTYSLWSVHERDTLTTNSGMVKLHLTNKTHWIMFVEKCLFIHMAVQPHWV